jgi:hypothetical protein
VRCAGPTYADPVRPIESDAFMSVGEHLGRRVPWITRLADDERKRDALRSSEVEAAARKTDLVRRHGRGLIDELRATIAQDIDAFRHEFPGDPARDVIIDSEAEGGFAVRKPGYPSVSLSVAPRWDVAAVGCCYRFTSNDGLPAREDRFELVFAPHRDDAAQFKHHGSGQVFATAETLSEYLLTPVFTGRPR